MPLQTIYTQLSHASHKKNSNKIQAKRHGNFKRGMLNICPCLGHGITQLSAFTNHIYPFPPPLVITRIPSLCPRSSPVALLYALDDVLVAPVPVGPLAVRHHFPRHDAEAPHVRGRGELAEGDGLGRRPPHRDLPSLWSQMGKSARYWNGQCQNQSSKLENKTRMGRDMTVHMRITLTY